METSLVESSAEAGGAAIDPRLLAPHPTENRDSNAPVVSTRKERLIGPGRQRFIDGIPYWEIKLLRRQPDVITKDKRLYLHLSEDHRLLLNSEIEEVAGVDLSRMKNPHKTRFQLGASQWTRIEYETFFRALARKGKNAIKDIATAIGTKSEVEVQCLLLHLSAASEQKSTGTVWDPVKFMNNIPAAIEVSDECCEALDRAATALSWVSEKNEIGSERVTHGENWLLDRQMAQMLSRAYDRDEKERHEMDATTDSGDEEDNDHEDGDNNADDDEDMVDKSPSEDPDTESHSETESDIPLIQPIRKQIPKPRYRRPEINDNELSSASGTLSEEDVARGRAALEYWPGGRLFNAPNWLELMHDLFMVQIPPDKPYIIGTAPNWRELAIRGQEPSIYHTAFSDFYDLTVNITRRLVRVCINQALSRTRAADNLLRERSQPTIDKPKVELVDAIATLELLNMPQNSDQIFAGTMRKCRLAIESMVDFFKDRKYRAKSRSNYDFVEELLGSPSYRRDCKRAHIIATAVQQSDSATESSDTSDAEGTEGEEHDDPERNLITAEDLVAGDPKNQTEKHRAAVELGLDPMTEAFDQAQDAREELQLWKTLGIAPPEEIKNRSTNFSPGSSLLAKPFAKRRAYQRVIDDWRDWTDYRAEWESYGPIRVHRRQFIATEMLIRNRRGKRRKRKREAEKSKAARKRQRMEHQDEAGGDELITSNEEEAEETDNSETEAEEENYGSDIGSDLDEPESPDEALEYPSPPQDENMSVDGEENHEGTEDI